MYPSQAVRTQTTCLCQLAQERSPDLAAVRLCVAGGANVMAPILYEEYRVVPVLSQLIREGQRDVVLACLESPLPVDFTVTDPSDQTPLHALVCALQVEQHATNYYREVMRAIVYRVSTHLADVVQWGAKDLYGFDFLSLAAQHQLLHILWPEVEEVPYFADQVAPIPLLGEVWEWDWNALDASAQQRLQCDTALYFHRADAYTAELWRLLQDPYTSSAKYTKMKWCVRRGADVMYCVRCKNNPSIPIFSYAVRHSIPRLGAILLRLEEEEEEEADVELREAQEPALDAPEPAILLPTPKEVNTSLDVAIPHSPVCFTSSGFKVCGSGPLSDVWGGRRASNTTLHRDRRSSTSLFLGVPPTRSPELCTAPQRESSLRTERRSAVPFQTFVKGSVEAPWPHKGAEPEDDSLCGATRLHTSHPSLRSPHHPSRRTSGIHDGYLIPMLSSHPSLHPQTSAVTYSCSSISDSDSDGSAAAPSQPHPMPREGEAACPRRGAHTPSRENSAVLPRFRDHRPLDFTITDAMGETPLHKLIGSFRRAGEVREWLHVVLDRLETHPHDIVNWGKANQYGLDPMSLAASQGHLATWVSVVLHQRPVRYYVQHTGKFVLSCSVREKDWAALSWEDQQRFEVKGVEAAAVKGP